MAKVTGVLEGNGAGVLSDLVETTAAPAKVFSIAPPRFEEISLKIRGIAPLVLNKFSNKARQQIHDTQAAGSTARKGKQREAKDFQQAYQDALHKSAEGWYGIPAPAFRNAMVSACRTVGFAMTRAKLAVFVEADGFGDDGSPLVRITKGEPKYLESFVRNASGVVDLRARPMWDPGWEADIRVRFDSDMFAVQDVLNLLARVGLQVGIGEGRPDSKNSTGMGWGMFVVVGPGEEAS